MGLQIMHNRSSQQQVHTRRPGPVSHSKEGKTEQPLQGLQGSWYT